MRKMTSYQKGVETKVRKNIPDGEFTVRDLQVNARYVNVSNAVHKLEREGVIVRAGQVKNGGRGRPRIVYKQA